MPRWHPVSGRGPTWGAVSHGVTEVGIHACSQRESERHEGQVVFVPKLKRVADVCIGPLLDIIMLRVSLFHCQTYTLTFPS